MKQICLVLCKMMFVLFFCRLNSFGQIKEKSFNKNDVQLISELVLDGSVNNEIRIDKELLKTVVNDKLNKLTFPIIIDGISKSIVLIRNKSLEDFTIYENGDYSKPKANANAYYIGNIEGNINSKVIAEISENNFVLQIYDGRVNYILSQINSTNRFIDMQIMQNNKLKNPTDMPRNLVCSVKESIEKAILSEVDKNINSGSTSNINQANNCVNVYLETDYEIYQLASNNLNTLNSYVTSLFSYVSNLYGMHGISVKLCAINNWTTPDPYSNSNMSLALSQFQNQVGQTYPCDIAHLISSNDYQYRGLAVSNFLSTTKSKRMSMSGYHDLDLTIQDDFNDNIHVVAHETGHTLGSPHTFECFWNGNNTAIDGCGTDLESTLCGVANPGIPSFEIGGTVMSYCSVYAGNTRFANGFGPQPSMRIKNAINNAPFLTYCNCDGDFYLPLICGGLNESSTWIKSILSYIIAYNNNTIIDANPNGGYIDLKPISNTDRISAQIITSNNSILFALLDGCGIQGSSSKMSKSETQFATSAPTITLYPNPASNNITISSTVAIQSLSIQTMDGKTIQVIDTKALNDTGNMQVNISTLANGLYLVIAHSQNGIFTQKLIKH